MTTEVLAAKGTQELTPLVEFTTEDGSTGLSLTTLADVPDSIHGVKLVEFWPEAEEKFDVTRKLLTESRGGSREETTPLRLVEASQEVLNLDNVKAFAGFIGMLGYRLSHEEHSEHGTTTRETTVTYPTIARVNAFLETNFQDSTIRFEDYDGSIYTTMEFLGAFVERGHILISTQQPLELHDHVALHVLGWIGLGGDEKLITRLREDLGAYMLRAKAEESLPEVPYSAPSYFDDEEFLYPSRKVLHRAMRNLDGLSFNIANTLFNRNDKPYSRNIDDLAFQIQQMFSFSSIQDGKNIPNWALGDMSYDETQETAINILGRYIRASQSFYI